MPTRTIRPRRRPCRVALYLATRDLHPSSVLRQEMRLRAYLLSRPDWRPVAEYHDYGYRDDRRWARPALRRAVADARAGQFDVLLVAEPDRLGRAGPPLVARLTELDAAGVTVHTADGALNTADPAGRLVLAVFTAVASYQLDAARIRDRVALSTNAAGGAAPRAARRRRRRGGAQVRRDLTQAGG